MAAHNTNRPVGGSSGGFAGLPSTHGWNRARTPVVGVPWHGAGGNRNWGTQGWAQLQLE